ncbi:hypothetical protein EV128_107301 [Rhizobium azibense]|nr:hypothetical protein EV128_107301 [Rhizobium azibense]
MSGKSEEVTVEPNILVVRRNQEAPTGRERETGRGLHCAPRSNQRSRLSIRCTGRSCRHGADQNLLDQILAVDGGAGHTGAVAVQPWPDVRKQAFKCIIVAHKNPVRADLSDWCDITASPTIDFNEASAAILGK